MLNLRKAAKPYRILLLYTSLRRDKASLFILQRLLSALGCEVIIAGPTNQNMLLSSWTPHAVVHVTPSKVPHAMALAPKSRFFILNAEGAEGANRPVECALFQEARFQEQVARVYIWGIKPFELMLDSFNSAKNHKAQRILETGDITRIVGYYRSDISHYISRIHKRQQSTIGFLSHFFYLNNIDRLPMISLTFGIKESFLESTIQLKHYVFFNEAVCRLVESTNHMVSIRPHHLEFTKGYYSYSKLRYRFTTEAYNSTQFTGRVSLDYTPDYALWAIRQKAIVASDSSAFLDSVLLGVPYINIDQAAGNLDNIFARESLFGERALCAKRPATLEELFELLDDPSSATHDQDRFDRLSKAYYTLENAGSILPNVAQDIVNSLDERCHNLAQRLPTPLIKARAAANLLSASLRSKLFGSEYHESSQPMATGVYESIAEAMLKDAAEGNIPDLCRV